MTNRDFDEQTEGEMIDWLYIALCAGLISFLILASVCGHHWVSLGVGS